MAKPKNIAWASAIIGVVFLMLAVMIAPAVTAQYVPWANKTLRDLDVDTPVFSDADTHELELDEISYTFNDADGDSHTVVLNSANTVTNLAGCADCGADIESEADVAAFDVDLAGDTTTNYTAKPDYTDDGGGVNGHFVHLVLNTSVQDLWDLDVRTLCLGLDGPTSGLSLAGEDADGDPEQNYKLTLGAGDHIIYTTSVDGEDGNTNDVGSCLDQSDSGDTDPLFSLTLDVEEIMAHLNDAYLGVDPEDPEQLYLRVHGIRVEGVDSETFIMDGAAGAENETADADLFTVYFEGYSWGDNHITYGKGTATAAITIGAIEIVGAALMTAFLNFPTGSTKGIKLRKGGN